MARMVELISLSLSCGLGSILRNEFLLERYVHTTNNRNDHDILINFHQHRHYEKIILKLSGLF